MPLPLPPARMGAGEARNGSRDNVPCGSRAAPWKESPWIEKIISFGVNRQVEQRKRLKRAHFPYRIGKEVNTWKDQAVYRHRYPYPCSSDLSTI